MNIWHRSWKPIIPLHDSIQKLNSAIVLAHPDTAKVFTYITGHFQFTINWVINYMLVLYADDAKEVLVEPIKSQSNLDILLNMMYYIAH